MILNKIKIRNFLSIKKIDLDFSDFRGVTLIDGINKDSSVETSNGSGKSAIIEAVIWGLFGKTVRKTVEKTISNLHSDSGCYVELVVNNNVIIRRGKKPSRLEVMVDKVDMSKESSPKTQEHLEKLLDISYKSTLASLIYGQHNTVSFMSASPEEKRNLIQRYLNIDKIFKLRESTLKLKSESNLFFKKEETKCSVYRKELDYLTSKIAKIKASVRNGSSLLKNPKLLKILEEKTLDELYDQEIEREALSVGIVDLERRKEGVSQTIDKNKNLIEFLSNNKCSNCGYLNDSSLEKAEEAKKEIESARKEIKKLESSLSKKASAYDSISVEISNADLDVLKNLSQLTNELNSLKDSKKRQKSLYNSSARKTAKFKKRYELFKFWERAFSEKGLIKYIIRNVLDFLNERCNHYLSFLSLSTFHVNVLEDLNVILFHDTKEKAYDVLSGGEKRRLELAVTLALNDLASLSNNTHTDSVFFDEAAENLDPEGVKGFFNLLKEISKVKKIFVISHNQYLRSLLDDVSTLTVVKKDGNTTVAKIDKKNRTGSR